MDLISRNEPITHTNKQKIIYGNNSPSHSFHVVGNVTMSNKNLLCTFTRFRVGGVPNYGEEQN